MTTQDAADEIPDVVAAGVAATPLIASPTTWINRRVETIELLTNEETRRKVSVDFTLSDATMADLTTDEGVVVPISVLTKEARRNFDLRDESGRAVPVLGKHQNGPLTQVAVLNAALDALGESPSTDALELLASDLGQIVAGDAADSEEALSVFVGSAKRGDSLRATVWNDPTCRGLLELLWQHYVLFAVIPTGGPNRRILKYSYGDDFELSTTPDRLKDRLHPREVKRRIIHPDFERFSIECPGASRAMSFHVEVAIPEELQFLQAVLYDFETETLYSSFDRKVNRASLYAHRDVEPNASVEAYIEVVPERTGRISHAAAISTVVAALLWLGVISGLDGGSPGPAVSILLAGAALYSGISANRGQHKLILIIFGGPQRWLAVSTLAALAGSATLAMAYPCDSPVAVWRYAAILASLAALRLSWSAIRSPA